jgi:hypothetical protein
VVAGSARLFADHRQVPLGGLRHLSDLRQQLVGAVLMGFGGVTALGCTVGQGLSGVSTLAIGSFIAVADKKLRDLNVTQRRCLSNHCLAKLYHRKVKN